MTHPTGEELLAQLEHDGILTRRSEDFDDPVFDPLVERLGGTRVSRHGDETNLVTTYRWPNTVEGSANASLVEAIAQNSKDRWPGHVGGLGPHYVILVVSWWPTAK